MYDTVFVSLLIFETSTTLPPGQDPRSKPNFHHDDDRRVDDYEYLLPKLRAIHATPPSTANVRSYVDLSVTESDPNALPLLSQLKPLHTQLATATIAADGASSAVVIITFVAYTASQLRRVDLEIGGGRNTGLKPSVDSNVGRASALKGDSVAASFPCGRFSLGLASMFD